MRSIVHESGNLHYDKRYFNDHYGTFIMDKDYYRLLSEYWAKVIFQAAANVRPVSNSCILDYGAGTGVVTAAFTNTACFDVAEYSVGLLRTLGRKVYDSAKEIPSAVFDGVLCSHSLEHYEEPKNTLESFHTYVRSGGFLILILPVDNDFSPKITPDDNQHLYCWNFQTISNLLRRCRWNPIFGTIIYGPFLLRTLGHVLSSEYAVDFARALGRVKRGFKSILVLSETYF
jgi:SAM-dependent methyltransferase